MKTLNHPYNHQRGAAALVVAVILLFASTLIVLYAGKVGVQDQRISGNDYRAKQAFANAEAGLDYVAARLLANVNFTNTVSYPSTASEPVFYSASLFPDLTIRSQGYAEFMNSNATATVRQTFGYSNLFGSGPDAPMIVAGNVPPSGNMEIVGNPNGGGTGVNVAVWTSMDINNMGSSTTCKRAEYEANGSPSPSSTSDFNVCDANSCICGGTGSSLDGIISKAGTIGPDIVDNDLNFPDDVFAYVFGIPVDQYRTIRDKAGTTIVANCSGLNANSHGIYWVTGDCTIPADIGGGICGSDLCAVVLVVDNANLQINANKKFFGILFMFDNPDKPGAGKANSAGGASVYGAFIANYDVFNYAGSHINGTFDVVYERAVFQAIADDKSNQLLSRVAGTWIDQ